MRGGRWEDCWVKLGVGRRLGSRRMVRMFETNPVADSVYASFAFAVVKFAN